jgi:hypothetical protein
MGFKPVVALSLLLRVGKSLKGSGLSADIVRHVAERRKDGKDSSGSESNEGDSQHIQVSFQIDGRVQARPAPLTVWRRPGYGGARAFAGNRLHK